MELANEITSYDALVRRIFHIDDITTGNPQKDYLVRYRGRLLSEDSATAYDQLSAGLAPLGITPLFRIENDQQVILLVPKRPAPKPSNPWVNGVMFVLTFLAVSFAGLSNSGEMPPADPLQGFLAIFRLGWPFTVSLLAILLTHEFGHYLMSRHHHVHATLPYFIPFLPPFGTMGAVIMMKEMPKNRRQLLDIGLAGPLSGLVVAIPVLIIGLLLSHIERLPASVAPGTYFMLEGNSLLYLLLKFIVFGQWLPTPASYGGMSGVLYWLRFFFSGQPYPFGGLDVTLHPVALAGWAGILVTALNLIPAGQLDGGHVMYVLLGKKKAARLLPFLIGAAILLGFFWNGWWLWAALLFFLGRAYDDPLDQITPLDSRRRALAILALVIFILVFTPVPMNIIGG